MTGLRTLKTPPGAVELHPLKEKELSRVTSLVSLVFNITHGQKAILNNIERSILSI
jgi:hypothetical protein